jgi:hypothetical protein
MNHAQKERKKERNLSSNDTHKKAHRMWAFILTEPK